MQDLICFTHLSIFIVQTHAWHIKVLNKHLLTIWQIHSDDLY